MFGWFKKKPRWVDEPDEVYRTRARADAALVRTARTSTLPVIVTSFFPESLERVESALALAGTGCTRLNFGGGTNASTPAGVWSLDASRLAHAYGFDGWLLASGKEFSFLFVEHHPFASVEKIVLDVLDDASNTRTQRVRFFVGLDEPLMRAFAGERVVALMDRLGMQEDEAIRHPMVDRAIVNAQRKLERATPNAVPTRSSEEWFATNLRRPA